MINQQVIERENYPRYINMLDKQYDTVKEYFSSTELIGEYTQASSEDYLYFKINEIIYDDQPKSLVSLLFALYIMSVPLNFVYRYDGEKLEIFVGTISNKILELYRMINGSVCVHADAVENEINGISSDDYYSSSNIFKGYNNLNKSGIIKGDVKYQEEKFEKALIDRVMQGMQNEKFVIVVTASPMEKKDIIKYERIWSEVQSYAQMIKSRQCSIHDDLESISYSAISYKTISFFDLIDKMYKKYTEAVNKGLWDVCIKYYAESEEAADALAGILIANTCSDDLPEPVRSMSLNYELNCDDSILKNKISINVFDDIIAYYPVASNWYTSDELGVFVGFPYKDQPGVPVKNIASFDVARQTSNGICLGDIFRSERNTYNKYYLNYNELNRHALVVGLTGGGKTNTIKNILMSVYNSSKVPFLIIEPAKREYWELYKLGCNDLKIFSIGSKLNKLCINPFQPVKGVSIQKHIDYVFAAFKASFIMYPPMPYVLERAIYDIYEECGWDISNNYNKFGDVYPTIENLCNKIPFTVVDMGYDSREQKNIIGAVQARMNSLRVGVKGDILNVRESYSIEDILNSNVVIELEDIGDDDVKAFIMSMILIQVMEKRSIEIDCHLELKHLILIEEAHRLLKNVGSGSGENADPRGNAVEFFCNMLAELRSKGQGFIIADQIPSKLAPDIVKNTNLKIVHRLVAQDDRELVGKCMNMNEDQIRYLSTLIQGNAAIYSEGDYCSKIVRGPYAGEYSKIERKNMNHDEVCSKCTYEIKKNLLNQSGLSFICATCPSNCNGQCLNDVYKYFSDNEISTIIKKLEKNNNKEYFERVIVTAYKSMSDEGLPSKDVYIKMHCFLAEIVSRSKAEDKIVPYIYYDFYRIVNQLFE